MPALLEQNQVGKRESLADVIANVESAAAPFSSQIPKRPRPVNNLHSWQLKKYKRKGFAGVLDNKDADEFGHNDRSRVYSLGQKVWDNPAISDFADEAEIAGLGRAEMAEQIADSLIAVKHIVEAVGLSDNDLQVDDGASPNETRGFYCWVQSGAQTLHPVPEAYRPPAASIYTDALADLTEEAFKAMARSAFKQRRGPHDLDGFVGIELKAEFTKWTILTPTVSNYTNVRTFNQNLSRTIQSTVDMLDLDTGKIRLHPSSFCLLDKTTGEDTAYTHKSGIFLDMEMAWMAYVRKPRVRKLEDKGGGPRAIVDSIFMYGCDNPGGQMAVKTNA